MIIMRIIQFTILGKVVMGKPLTVLILKFGVKKLFWLLNIITMGLNENRRMHGVSLCS